MKIKHFLFAALMGGAACLASCGNSDSTLKFDGSGDVGQVVIPETCRMTPIQIHTPYRLRA